MDTPSPILPAELSPIVALSHIAETPFHWVSGEALPSPYQQLLVHEHDMTTELAIFHSDHLTLEVLQSQKEGELYLREVVLHTEKTRTAVEYGVIEILLESYPPELHQEILDGRLPLGEILNKSGLNYRSEPQGFFHVPASGLSDLFPASAGSNILYGRYNHLIRADNSLTLAKILEILPS